jgi:tRNA threonylcarbamoyladenosine biosynthesis protein TsaE
VTVSREIVTDSPGATVFLAERLTPALPRGTVLLLDGELGGGKTTFVKGLARGLAVAEEPRSPTFALIREYGILVHVDLFRLTATEAAGLGWEDYLDGDRIIAVEWSSHLPPAFWVKSSLILRLNFEILDERRRKIVLAYDESAPAELRERIEELFCA